MLSKSKVNQHQFEVQLSRQLFPQDCAAICQAVLKHLLFVRAQMPGMYDELKAEVQVGECVEYPRGTISF